MQNSRRVILIIVSVWLEVILQRSIRMYDKYNTINSKTIFLLFDMPFLPNPYLIYPLLNYILLYN